MKFLSEELESLERLDLRRRLASHRLCPGRYLEIDGSQLLNFSSNNYLGIADHAQLKEGAKSALSAGTGATASRLVTGNLELHDKLESRLAEFLGLEAARVFGSGFQANLGLLSCIAGPGDLIISDRLNHASIIDGIRLSGADYTISNHCCLDSVEAFLDESSSRPTPNSIDAKRSRRHFVITESVFSMDGDRPDLLGLRRLCDDYGAYLLVDEAHAIGCLAGGRGLCHDLNVVPDALIAGFGKAFGSYGGFVGGSSALCEFLLNHARSFVFTTALPPAVIGANLAALALLSDVEGERLRALLSERIEEFSVGLEALGLPVPRGPSSAIFPLIIGDTQRTICIATSLRALGLHCQAIRPPTVAHGSARLRVTLSAEHLGDDISKLLAGLKLVI